MVHICIIVRDVVDESLGRYRLLYLVNAKIARDTRILLQYYVYVNPLFVFLRWQEKGKYSP